MSDVSEDAASVRTLITGLVFIEIIWWLGSGMVYAAIYSGVFGFGTAATSIISLLGTVVMWVAVAMAMRWFQDRHWMVLVRPISRAVQDFGAVLKLSGGLMLGLSLWSVLPFVADAAYTRPLWQWLLILPFALIATFVQTTAEEIYFRGFLQSTLAARFKSPIMWAVLPSVGFGLLHVFNANTAPEMLQTVVYTSIFGFFAADLTARTGTLGAAIAFHFVHNAVLFCVYGFEDSPEAPLALWVFAPFEGYRGASGAPAGILDPTMILDTLYLLATLTLIWLAARVAIRR
ncbi:MAG: CPBP family intramembrane glutamic endopeptidase [Pseudomonadota bacterium]